MKSRVVRLEYKARNYYKKVETQLGVENKEKESWVKMEGENMEGKIWEISDLSRVIMWRDERECGVKV